MKIQGKVAVVTGAGSGIGEATARDLVKRGVKAIGLVDRSPNVELIARAVHEQRSLFVYYCGEMEAGRRQPALLEALKQGCPTTLANGWTARFEHSQTFLGHEEMFTYQVYRLANSAEVSAPR